nr:MAG TPA: hypothetical protein [Caudoviricetes sp.]
MPLLSVPFGGRFMPGGKAVCISVAPHIGC